MLEANKSDVLSYFVAFECPANSEYSICANPCQATCTTPGVDYSMCPEFCNEGCECVNGTVLEGGRCIPQEQCGCEYGGSYHMVSSFVAFR